MKDEEIIDRLSALVLHGSTRTPGGALRQARRHAKRIKRWQEREARRAPKRAKHILDARAQLRAFEKEQHE